MRLCTNLLALALFGASASPLLSQVPERFQGSWVVDAGATATMIAADPNMPEENKSGWTERWLSSGAELRVTESSVVIDVMEGGPIGLSVTGAEDSGQAAVLSATLSGAAPAGGMSVSIELRLTPDGGLNLRIREENDFDLVVWERTEDGA